MVLGKMKYPANLLMTLIAGVGILARVDDEFIEPAPTARRDVFAARTVAGLTTTLAAHRGVFHVQPRVRTGREYSCNICVTIEAGLIPDISSALDLQRRYHRTIHGRTGVDQ